MAKVGANSAASTIALTGAAALATSALVVAMSMSVMDGMKRQAVESVESAIALNAIVDSDGAEDVREGSSDATVDADSAAEAPDVSMRDGAPIEADEHADGADRVDSSAVDDVTDGAHGDSLTDTVTSPAASSSDRVYHVVWGDTLSGISDATGRSVDAIVNANGIRDVNLIYADSSLVIPD